MRGVNESFAPEAPAMSPASDVAADCARSLVPSRALLSFRRPPTKKAIECVKERRSSRSELRINFLFHRETSFQPRIHLLVCIYLTHP